MEGWFSRAGRAVLFEALSDVCDRLDTDFRNDFHAHTRTNEQLSTELDILRRKASEVERLEEENVALIAEIKALKDFYHDDTYKPDGTKQTDATPIPRTPRTPLAPQSVNQLNFSKHAATGEIQSLTVSKLKADVSRAEGKYTRLYNKYLEVQNLLRKSNQLVRDRNHKIKSWEEHVKEMNEQLVKRALRIKKLEVKCTGVNQEVSNSSFSSDNSDAAIGTELEMAAICPPNIGRPHAPEPNKSIGSISRRGIPGLTGNGNGRRSPLIASIESNGQASEIEINDPPTAIERSPRLPPLSRDPAISVKKVHTKSEPLSDTPVIVSERHIRKRKQIDDDEAGSRVAKIKLEHTETLSSDELRPFSPQESIDLDLENRTVRTPKKNTKYWHDKGAGISGGLDARGYETTIRGAAPQSTADDQPHRARSVSTQSRGQRAPAATPRGLASLAEDDGGYIDESENEHEDTAGSVSKLQPSANGLAHFLNTPTPAQTNTVQQNSAHRVTSSAATGARVADFFQLPKKRELPFGKDRSKRVEETPDNRQNRPGNTDSSLHQGCWAKPSTGKEKAKRESRLRHLPTERLQLADFKVNPDANEGYDYAFSDVVRNKDERACLQGCIKENCCGGKFRALARTYRPNTRPLEFQSLLESYLGDQCHRLASMSEGEKEALWLEAKTRELADAHGRHRHRYRPMSTPPGFWRLDFPSTQEGEQDGEEAAEMERDTIEERYREAMRPGGRWMFRDE